MDINKAIKERRSVRDYFEKKVPLDLVSECLDAARYAPAAGNIQNVYFIIVQDKKKRASISKAAGQSWMAVPPVQIVICNKKEKLIKMYGEKGDAYSLQNCAMAAQNLMLKAYSLGLSTCYVASLDQIKLQRALKLPDDVKAEAVITLGYSDKKPEVPRKLEPNKITFFEQYGNILK